jgi:hypothetical protein
VTGVVTAMVLVAVLGLIEVIGRPAPVKAAIHHAGA